jgi:hypothetical protein
MDQSGRGGLGGFLRLLLRLLLVDLVVVDGEVEKIALRKKRLAIFLHGSSNSTFTSTKRVFVTKRVAIFIRVLLVGK